MEMIQIFPARSATGQVNETHWRKMNEVEMQELQNRVVEGIQDYFNAYDWDSKFIQHFGE